MGYMDFLLLEALIYVERKYKDVHILKKVTNFKEHSTYHIKDMNNKGTHTNKFYIKAFPFRVNSSIPLGVM